MSGLLTLTKEQAQARMQAYLNEEVCECEGEFAIVENATREFEFGWVFFYENSEYLESGDEMDRAVGNAPVLIDRTSGEVHVTGTARSVDDYIEAYRRHGTYHPA